MSLRAAYAGVALLAAGAAISDQALGPVYRIAEPDLLARIEDAAAQARDDGSWDRLLEQARQQATARIVRPPAVPGLAAAARDSVRLFDPSIATRQPVVDAAGQVLAAAGTVVNPLDHVELAGRLLFIAGDDAAQYAYALATARQAKDVRVILTSGSPHELAAELGRQVYFDQAGVLVRRLGLAELPATVSQAGRLLRIETRALGARTGG